MKQYVRYLFPFLMIVLFVTGCEINRPANQTDVTPIADTGGEMPSGGDTAGEAGTTPPPAQPPSDTGDIETAVFNAPEAPNVPPERSVIIKLEQQASIQARGAELNDQGVVVAGVPGLDERLQQIGAGELEPMIEEVAEADNESLESFSAQAEEVSQLYVVNYSAEEDPEVVAQLLEEDPTVEYAEPNYIAGIVNYPVEVPAALIPNDQYYNLQWNLPEIQMPEAWDKATGQGVTVAVIDTGVAIGSDLEQTNILQGYDFVNNDNDPNDDQGHGTHVAGTIAQSTNNEIGVAGVAYNATILPIKVLGANGQGSYEAIIKGITYAVDQGADVINLSLAGRSGSQALLEAVQYAHNRGVVVVAAAGNSSGAVNFPAAYDDFVIGVGATTLNRTRAPYSNFGNEIDIAAPGGDVNNDANADGFGDGILQQTLSTSGNGFSYRFLEGTSMAAPHVAGVAALMLERNPNATPAEIEAAMTQTALSTGFDQALGPGILQASAAIDAIGGQAGGPTVTPTVTDQSPPSTPTNTPELPTQTPPPPTETPTTVPPTLTPVVTPDQNVTPPPVDGTNLLTNGDFEGDQGWVFGDTPIRGNYTTERAVSGSRSAMLGALQGPDLFSFSSVWQQVSIPPDANQVTLQASIYRVSQDVPGSDIQYIMILDQNFRVVRVLSRELSNSQSWETVTYELSGLSGQTVYVYFSVFNRGRSGNLSAMYVDNVSLTWSP